MKRILTFFMALLMMTVTLSSGITAQAAAPSAPTFTRDSGEYTDDVTITLLPGSLLVDTYYEIYEYGLSNMEGELKQAKTKYSLPFRA